MYEKNAYFKDFHASHAAISRPPDYQQLLSQCRPTGALHQSAVEYQWTHMLRWRERRMATHYV